MNPQDFHISRREELLADRALQGLSEEERDELEGLVDDFQVEGLALELAAAEANLAFSEPDLEAMPALLWDRLAQAAEVHFDNQEDRRSWEIHGPRFPKSRETRQPWAIRARVFPWLGWLAAAASILYAVRINRIEPKIPEPVRELTLTDRLADVTPRPLANTDHPLARGGKGTLSWSDDRQEGYLAIQGLAEVEPGQGVYQLWIFDASRDDRFPVDGGTFAVEDSKTTTMVPIKPSLVVRRPTLFAVTLEPAGGVVVSDRKRILLTAGVAP